MILYVNSCVREGSRTHRLAGAVLEGLCGAIEKKDFAEGGNAFCCTDSGAGYEKRESPLRNVKEVYLPELNLRPLSRERLKKRDELIGKGKFDDEMFSLARDFKEAEYIVVSAPFWDLSFPSVLKTYMENIYIVGLLTRFSPEGVPEGACRAKKLYYVATSGGKYVPDYSYNYIRDIAVNYFGIKETELILAENLDIAGFDAEAIMRETLSKLKISG